VGEKRGVPPAFSQKRACGKKDNQGKNELAGGYLRRRVFRHCEGGRGRTGLIKGARPKTI